MRPPTPPLRRSTSEGPPVSLAKTEAALNHHKECLVRLRLNPHGGEPAWYLFLGEVTGTANDARSTERARIHVEALGVNLSVPWTQIEILDGQKQAHTAGVGR